MEKGTYLPSAQRRVWLWTYSSTTPLPRKQFCCHVEWSRTAATYREQALGTLLSKINLARMLIDQVQELEARYLTDAVAGLCLGESNTSEELDPDLGETFEAAASLCEESECVGEANKLQKTTDGDFQVEQLIRTGFQ